MEVKGTAREADGIKRTLAESQPLVERVACFVLDDFKPQEAMNCIQSGLVGCLNHNPPAIRCGFDRVVNMFCAFFQNRNTWRHGIVHKHRYVEVSTLEGVLNVTQMHLDAISADQRFQGHSCQTR